VKFAVADIVEVLTDSTDVKQYIKRMRPSDSLFLKYSHSPFIMQKYLEVSEKIPIFAADR